MIKAPKPKKQNKQDIKLTSELIQEYLPELLKIRSPDQLRNMNADALLALILEIKFPPFRVAFKRNLKIWYTNRILTPLIKLRAALRDIIHFLVFEITQISIIAGEFLFDTLKLFWWLFITVFGWAYYFIIAGLVCFHILSPWLRPFRIAWGVTRKDTQRAMPGDSLVPKPLWKYTRGIKIKTEPDKVWPWLLMLGWSRGGFYTHARFLNLFGYKYKNRYELIPDFLDVREGDKMWVHHQWPPFVIQDIQTHRHLVMHVKVDLNEFLPRRKKVNMEVTVAISWQLMIEKLPNKCCKLFVRGRFFHWPATHKLAQKMFGLSLEPKLFVFERAMIKEIKRLAEGKRHYKQLVVQETEFIYEN